MNEKVSIIVPLYNAEKFIDECIQSVLNQTYPNWELVIVNDGSTDKSLEICENYAADETRIRIFTKGNEGSASARNYGLDKMTGQCITFIDADDYVNADYLERMLSVLHAFDADIVVTRRWQDKKRAVPEMDRAFTSKRDILSECIPNKENSYRTYIWGRIYRSTLKSSLYCDKKYKRAEDMVSFVGAVAASGTVVLSSYEGYHWRQNTNSLTHRFHEEDVSSLEVETCVAAMLQGDEVLLRMLRITTSTRSHWLLLQAAQINYKNRSVIGKLQKNAKRSKLAELHIGWKEKLKFAVVSWGMPGYNGMRFFYKVKKRLMPNR